jgi:beta-lactam-binding protein with PASTA domain
MPTMPNVVGLNIDEATAALETAGVLNTQVLGYFGTWPITVNWEPEANVAPGIVASQSPAATDTVDENSAVTLTASNLPVAVIYP